MGEHDKLFRRTFSVAEHASGELRSLLPPEVTAALDLARLERLPGSFVDPELRERHADLLFRVPRAESGDPVYLYVLLEHQSTADPLMPWRVLGYLQRVWARLLRDAPERTTLPPVVSLVVHHGEAGWTAPRRLHELIEGLDEVPGLAPFVPDIELMIDDLPGQDDEGLASRPLGILPRVVLWLLRDGRDIDELLGHLEAWGQALEDLVQEANPEDVAMVMRYILRVGGEASFEAVRRRIVEAAPLVEESMASAAEQLIQQGIEQGIERGIERGVRETLLRQLGVRFGPLSRELEERVARASSEELDRCIERVVTASRPEDVFE